MLGRKVDHFLERPPLATKTTQRGIYILTLMQLLFILQKNEIHVPFLLSYLAHHNFRVILPYTAQENVSYYKL